MDRSPTAFPWRLDRAFMAVSFAVLHRRALMRAVRAKLSAPAFRDTLHDLQSLRSIDFRQVFDVVGAQGGVPQALRSHDVSASMKNLLRTLRLVTGSVPCTDAARTTMRHELTALQVYYGFSALFVTLNPCDTRHPLTCKLRLPDEPSLDFAIPCLDSAFPLCSLWICLAYSLPIRSQLPAHFMFMWSSF